MKGAKNYKSASGPLRYTLLDHQNTYVIMMRTIISNPASVRNTAPLNDSAVSANMLLFKIGFRVIKPTNVTSFTAINVPAKIE